MQKKYIFIDPDGTFDNWIYLLVENQTNIVYSSQCNGTDNEIRYLEGFLIPIGGDVYDVGMNQKIDIDRFVNIFKKKSKFQTNNFNIEELKKIIENITIWYSEEIDGNDVRNYLMLNESRINEAVEAWIPVLTPWGDGVLVWKNSD